MGAISSPRSMTLLNSLGDVTIVWKPEKDKEIKDLIAAYVKKGIRFFIIEKVPLLPFYRRTSVSDPTKLPERRIKIDDAQLSKLVDSGHVELARAGTDVMEFVRATNDVEEIATSNTVATQPMVGG
jgi:hypothetical protein